MRIASAIERSVWPLIAEGKLKPVIDSTFSLDRAAEAHRRIDDPDHIGKIVLEIHKGLASVGNCLGEDHGLYKASFPLLVTSDSFPS